MAKITEFVTHDVRFPTSMQLDGSDAMNPSPDYSAAYLIIRTDEADPQAAASRCPGIASCSRSAMATRCSLPLSVPWSGSWPAVTWTRSSATWAACTGRLVGYSPMRWLGPECGITHMAIGAVVNACWDLAARRAGKPLWLLLADLSPEELVGLVDFRYLTDALTPDEALELLERGQVGKGERAKSAEPGRLSGLLHDTWLAGLLRRHPRRALRASGPRRLHPGEAQGRSPA